jgi:DNA-binding NtrC family response regulator
VRKRQFRADLYYRLRVLQVQVPPLRERDSDILLLAEHFLRDIGKRYRKEGLSLSPEAEQTLLNYSWPGNVRELRNAIEQAVLLCQGATLEPETLHLSSEMGERQTPASGNEEPAEFKLPDTGVDLAQIERHFVEQALRRTQGNVTKAASLLGLSRDTLRYRMDKFGLR